ncbi:phage terminase large subunit [Listeria grandensis]|uniref:Phage terminase large subunit n=1 Tax=Listeria grandensis TaxID=1494963 RepID=A0A7X1CQL5_9LIST|nr:phage terminase large subunit [Listeria grandensis]MBC1937178.1 phage terminase large subunit [Listeria grandensis]
MKKSIDRIEYLIIQREKAMRKARKHFWSFCQLLYPEFYKDDRLYLRDLCETLQAFAEDRIAKKILVINIPPRHGKTFTARLFVLWMFGQDPRLKIITGSYNQILSSLFAQQTRDGIVVENESVKSEYFSDIFPQVKLKYGDSAKAFWSLDGSEEKNYLATSPGGTSTGIGANYLIVDDILKSAVEANNERVLESHWYWYNSTLVQRMERPRKQILIMTRWATGDLAGRMMDARCDSVHQVIYKAVQDDGSMLCDEIMTKAEYLDVTQEMGKDIAEANYQQSPIDIKGRLYGQFKTYEKVPEDSNGSPLFSRISAYCDTADKGGDYLATFIYGEYNKEAYILDVVYTQEGMDETEPQVAEALYRNRVNNIVIESNSGGAGFARSVSRILREKYGSNHTKVDPQHQSKNKEARILSNATWVMDHIYFPVNWKDKWPELHTALSRYQREGKNAHDDAPDALTGVAENMVVRVTAKFFEGGL